MVRGSFILSILGVTAEAARACGRSRASSSDAHISFGLACMGRGFLTPPPVPLCFSRFQKSHPGARRNRAAGSPSRLGRTAGGLAVGDSSVLSPSAKGVVGGVSVAGAGAWDGDTEDPVLR